MNASMPIFKPRGINQDAVQQALAPMPQSPDRGSVDIEAALEAQKAAIAATAVKLKMRSKLYQDRVAAPNDNSPAGVIWP